LDTPEIKSYRDLRVWQEAMNLAEASYRLTKAFPRDEVFGRCARKDASSAHQISAKQKRRHGYLAPTRYSLLAIRFWAITTKSLREFPLDLLPERVKNLPQTQIGGEAGSWLHFSRISGTR
jgi:hypothetical protein